MESVLHDLLEEVKECPREARPAARLLSDTNNQGILYE